MPIRLVHSIFCAILIASSSLGSIQAADVTVKSWPVDLLLDRLVALRVAQNSTSYNFIEVQSNHADFDSIDMDKEVLNRPEQLYRLLVTALNDQEPRNAFLSWYGQTDVLAKRVTSDLHAIMRKKNLMGELYDVTLSQEQTESSAASNGEGLSVDNLRQLDDYEYSYGRELGRTTLKHFDAIHRQTFFENKSHNIDIGLDFLKPIKAVLRHLQLKEKFQWIFDNTLYFGYKASFKHHKKVFVRFKGYYAKLSVQFELMRRRRYWWGYGSWERVGVTNKVLEEPVAIVGTEVKELEEVPK